MSAQNDDIVEFFTLSSFEDKIATVLDICSEDVFIFEEVLNICHFIELLGQCVFLQTFTHNLLRANSNKWNIPSLL